MADEFIEIIVYLLPYYFLVVLHFIIVLLIFSFFNF